MDYERDDEIEESDQDEEEPQTRGNRLDKQKNMGSKGNAVFYTLVLC